MRPGTKKKRRPSLGERKIVRCALPSTAPKYVHVYQKSGLSTRENNSDQESTQTDKACCGKQLLVQNGANLSLHNNMVGLHCTLSRSTAPKYVHVYHKSGLSTRETTMIEKALKQTKRVVASVVSITCSKRSGFVTM